VKIGEILTETMVLAQLSAADKEGVLTELASHLHAHAADVPGGAQDVLRALIDRERLGSTGVGEGVAIPHAKIPGLNRLVACFGRAIQGIAFDSIDQQPVRLFFVLLVPENSAGAHLKALARISRLLKDSSFRKTLLEFPDQAAIYNGFLEEDDKY